MGRLSAWLSSRNPQAVDIARPHLDLNGEALGEALRAIVAGAEEQGGIERYIEPLKLKSALFQEVLGSGAEGLEFERFLQVCAFMPTVRRRLAPYLDAQGFARIRAGLAALLNGVTDVTTCNARIEAFCGCFPMDKEHRFIRDLAAEVLHNIDIERYPLMTRWVWDAKANTGILREIWFADNVDNLTIRVADDYATFLMLREELTQFLTANGVFRDVLQYVDLLTAQCYAKYICTQGGTYLRTEFSAPEDPMQHTRRMLGLDGVRPGSNRTRLKAIDGQGYIIEDAKMIG